MEENYLENIRSYIISEQARTIVRDYSANKSKLETNYNIGKELSEAGKHYGEGIVKKYAKELTKEFGKGYGITELRKMRAFYYIAQKCAPLGRVLTWSHYKLLLPLKNLDEIKFYIDLTIRDNLSKRALAERIKSNEYGRLAPETKQKLKEEKEISEEEGEDNMFENTKEIVEKNETSKDNSSLFEKYDDMTLFNKVILSLNTAEEKLSRKEGKLEKSKADVEERLSNTNANIEANIERENKLSQRKLELNAREVELNSKLSEAEVIFLNMKPLIKGLNKIKDANLEGGNDNE